MSLTNLIRTDKEFRHRVDTTFPRPERDSMKVLLVAPPKTSSTDAKPWSGRIGTAFDYLFRLVLRQRNPDAAIYEREWVAENPIITRKLIKDWSSGEQKRKEIRQSLEKSYVWRVSEQGLDCMSINSMVNRPEEPWLRTGSDPHPQEGLHTECFFIKDQWLANNLRDGLSFDDLVEILFDSIGRHCCRISEYREAIAGARYYGERFVRTGVMPHELPHLLLKVSNLDTLCRTHSANFLPPDPDRLFTEDIMQGEIDDLLALYRTIPTNLFLGDEVSLNPVVSILNRDCSPKPAKPWNGGIKADADVIIDDLLIDVKTSMKKITPTLPLQDFCQLMGYFALTALGGKHQIKRLGIYYARFGYLFEFPVPRALPSTGGRAAFVEWFRQHVRIALKRIPQYKVPKTTKRTARRSR